MSGRNRLSTGSRVGQTSLQTAAEKFRRDMEKLGLGVSIQINGEPPVVIVEEPKK